PSAARDAVLSHHPYQHLDNLAIAHPPRFDQTRHHPHIADHDRIQPNSSALQLRRTSELPILIGPRFSVPSVAVPDLYLRLAFLGAVVLDTPLRRTPLAVRLFASKRTSQIPAPRVSWMRQEENSAMPAPGHTSAQLSSGSQDGPQHDVVLTHQCSHLARAVPIPAELKTLLDFDY